MVLFVLLSSYLEFVLVPPCFHSHVAAVNWLKPLRCRGQIQQGFEQEETGRMPPRSKQGRRPGFLTDIRRMPAQRSRRNIYALS